jgi:replicative superfamily II helicase
LINAAIDEGTATQLKSLVLDELHMIDDAHRGYLLEMIGTKVLSLEQSTQIVGMSATLPVSSVTNLILRRNY